MNSESKKQKKQMKPLHDVTFAYNKAVNIFGLCYDYFHRMPRSDREDSRIIRLIEKVIAGTEKP